MSVTKKDLYAAYAKHTKEGLDDLHEPGSDPDCAVCDEINLISLQLEGHPDATRAVQLDMVEVPVQKAIPTVWEVEEDDGSVSIIRTVTHRQEHSVLARGKQRRKIGTSEARRLGIAIEGTKVITLDQAIKRMGRAGGTIATWGEIELAKGTALRKPSQPDQYVQFDGGNLAAVQKIAEPANAHFTKKHDKVQVDAYAGSKQPSFSLEVGDILIRLATGRLLALSQTEFEALYDYDSQTGWTLAD